MDNLRKGILVKNGVAVGAVGDKYYSSTAIGVIQAFSGNIIPRGFLVANGASYPTADYPDLYAVIGNTYGGDTENFNVPDYRETVLVGVTYIIKAFHTNEGVDSGAGDDVINYIDNKIYNNTKVDVVLYDEFDIKEDNIQNRLYLLGDILFGSLYLRFDEEHDPLFIQGGIWFDIGDVPQITTAPQLYNCISYADTEVGNDYTQGDVRIWEGKLQVRVKKQSTVSRNNWYVFYQAVCMKVTLAE